MLAVVLVLSLGITAFAAEPTSGSITVTNAINDVNYKLFKIFDATYKPDTDTDDDGSNDTVAYTLSTDSPVYTEMFGNVETNADNKKVGEFFTYDVKTGGVTLHNTTGDVIQYLTDLVRELYNTNEVQNDGCFVAKVKASNQQVEFSNLPFGYYLIDTEDANNTTEDKAKIAVTITTNAPDIDVIEKNQVPGQLTKTTEDTQVGIGDEVNWEVGFTATNYDGDKKVLVYTIKDTLSSDWAAYNEGSVVVKVGEDELTLDEDYSLTFGTNDEGKPYFVINIEWYDEDLDAFKYGATEQVTITYSATVTENAASSDLSVDLENNAELNWNDETGGVGDGGDDDTDSDIHNMGFTKVDGNNSNAPLAGAEFMLYQIVDGNKVYVTVRETSTGVYIVDKTVTNKTVVSPADDEDDEDDDCGKVVIMGLAAGTYYLEETKAPDGYNKLGTDREVIVGGTTVVEGVETPVVDEIVIDGTTYTVSNAELNIVNNQGLELPSTGGKGTMMLITFGTMIAVAFAILMITQKKMSIYND